MVCREQFKLQENIDAERIGREAALTRIKDEFQELTQQRDKNDEIFQSDMLQRVSKVETELGIEEKVRCSEVHVCVWWPGRDGVRCDWW